MDRLKAQLDSTLADLAQLRARLAAAEAVIAALPECEKCHAPATGTDSVDGADYDTCDDHAMPYSDPLCGIGCSEHGYAAPLRVYLALVEAGK